jgi:AAA15 family ATPase/GTPase
MKPKGSDNMLKKFSVYNFKCFDEAITLDLSDIRNYTFNTELIKENLVHSSLIYGKNGAGKTSLGLAINDASMHLSDNQKDFTPYLNYTSGNKLLKDASFTYVISYSQEYEITYHYKKTNVNSFVYEELKINDEFIFYYDYKTNLYEVKDELFQTINLSTIQENQSVLKILNNNSTNVSNCHPIKYAFLFLNNITFLNTSIEEDYHILLEERMRLNKMLNNSFKNTDRFQKQPETYDALLKRINTSFNSFGFDVELKYNEKDKAIYRKYKSKLLPFDETASNGEKTLLSLACYLDSLFLSKGITMIVRSFQFEQSDNIVLGKKIDKPHPLEQLFIYDEFDAFYDYELSTKVLKSLIKKMDTQVIMTSHNTNLISNKLMRPDCYFVLEHNTVLPLHKKTDKEIRVGHSLEKMFIAGEFHFNE